MRSAGAGSAGVLWDIPATEVAHYAAVTAGLVIVLWLGGMLRGWVALLAAIAGVTLIVLTHTRTALVGYGGWPPGRRPEPDRDQGAGTQVFRDHWRHCVDRESLRLPEW